MCVCARIGGTTSTGCSGVLQLPALRLSHCLYHHALPHRQCQGVLWILLEGEKTHTHTFKFFLKALMWKGIIPNVWSFLPCGLLFSHVVLLSAPPVDEESFGNSPWPQCHLHHVSHNGGEVLSLVLAVWAYWACDAVEHILHTMMGVCVFL